MDDDRREFFSKYPSWIRKFLDSDIPDDRDWDALEAPGGILLLAQAVREYEAWLLKHPSALRDLRKRRSKEAMDYVKSTLPSRPRGRPKLSPEQLEEFMAMRNNLSLTELASKLNMTRDAVLKRQKAARRSKPPQDRS